MNLLEHYIKEIHNVEKYKSHQTNISKDIFVKVEITIDCYGIISRTKEIFTDGEWEKTKKRGYYLG